jgi:hypothetical protein
MTKRKIKKLLIRRAGLQKRIKVIEDIHSQSKTFTSYYVDKLADLSAAVGRIEEKLRQAGVDVDEKARGKHGVIS